VKKNEKYIWVYSDWELNGCPECMGILTAHRVRGKEIFAFEYNESWMNANHEALFLDPHLGFYKGKQYQPEEKNNFGIFLDSAPDRWGRLLMRRREAWQAKIEGRAEKTTLPPQIPANGAYTQ
jgi:serine/threonine-protein kinase HipA